VDIILANNAGFLNELQVTSCPKRIDEVIPSKEEMRTKHSKKVFFLLGFKDGSSH
jgi:hypothetical protein